MSGFMGTRRAVPLSCVNCGRRPPSDKQAANSRHDLHTPRYCRRTAYRETFKAGRPLWHGRIAPRFGRYSSSLTASRAVVNRQSSFVETRTSCLWIGSVEEPLRGRAPSRKSMTILVHNSRPRRSGGSTDADPTSCCRARDVRRRRVGAAAPRRRHANPARTAMPAGIARRRRCEGRRLWGGQLRLTTPANYAFLLDSSGD